MMGYVEAPRAWGLAQGMARATGVVLARAVVEGWISRRELAQMVSRCQVCGKSEDCLQWLSTLRSEPVPEFCANKQDLQALAPLG
jgi:hypothetical protein